MKNNELIKIKEKSRFKSFNVNKDIEKILNLYNNCFLKERKDYKVVCELGPGECTFLEVIKNKNNCKVDFHIFDKDPVILEIAKLKNIENLQFNNLNYATEIIEKEKTTLANIENVDLIISRFSINASLDSHLIESFVNNIKNISTKNTRVLILPYISSAYSRNDSVKNRFDSILKKYGYKSFKMSHAEVSDVDCKADWDPGKSIIYTK